MITDSEIRLTGMQILISKLGEVQAERFIRYVGCVPRTFIKTQYLL